MTTTTNRGYSTPATGTQNGIWGSDDLNPNFTLIDKNLGAVATVALTSSNVTLSSSEYVCGTIKFTGTLSANVTITFPSVSGWWTVINNCTGNYYIRLSCSVGGLKICPPPGEAIDVGFDATDAFYRNLPHPIGSYWDYAGSAVPVWVSGCSTPPYLLCDGSTYSAVTYPFLNTILGTTTLPDAQARARIALGGSTGRVTTAGSGIDGTTRFSAGGNQNTTITSTQMPAHTHTQEGQQPTFGYTVRTDVVTGGSTAVATSIQSSGGSFSVTTTADGTPGTTGSAGGSDVLILMQPTYVGGITMIRAA
jgi:microcystin-dependent protein